MQTPFTDAIDARLLSRGMTRYRLAKATGTTEGHVYNVLSGKRKLGRASISAWAVALGMDEGELMRLMVLDKYGVDAGGAPLSASASNQAPEGIPNPWVGLGLGVVPLYASTPGVRHMWTATLGSVPISGDLAGEVDGAFIVRGNDASARGVTDGTIVLAKRLAADERPLSGRLVVVDIDGIICVRVYREGPGGGYLERHRAGADAELAEPIGAVYLVGRVRAVITRTE